MSDLISRNNLLEIVEQTKRCLKPLNSDYMQGYVEALAGVEKVIELQPTVEAISKDKLQEIVEKIDDEISEYRETPYFDRYTKAVKVGTMFKAIEIVKKVGVE